MSSNPQFHIHTQGTEVAEVFKDKIRGRNILITGTNPVGLGTTTARILARHEPNLIVLTYRTKEKCDQVVADLRKDFPTLKLHTVHMDLSSLDSVRKAAKEVNDNAEVPHIDILLNNAGLMSIQSRNLTADGFEEHFETNYLGHFLFTNLVMPKLFAAAKNAPSGATRIVNQSAGWYQFSGVRFHDINFDGHPIPEEEQPNKEYLSKFGHNTTDLYIPEVAYAQSKTAQILQSLELNRRLHDRGILSYSVNPGGVHTEILRAMPQPKVEHILGLGLAQKDQDQGTSTSLVAMLDPKLNENTSPYLHDCQPTEAKPFARDPQLAEELWRRSEEWVGQKFPFDK